MNKVYGIIWNASLGNWVAVSETTKACGKRGKTVRALAVATLLAAGATSAQAQVNNVASGCTGISLPPSVVTQILAPLVGSLTPLTSPLGINLTGVTSGGPISVSALNTSGAPIVDTTKPCVSQNDGFSITNPKGISLGGNVITGLGNGITANAGEMNSIALGNNAQTNALALNSIAIGTNASVTGSASNAVALGSGATSAMANSVALGAGSSTFGASGIGGNAALGVTSNAGVVAAGSGNVVSVGKPGAERQIQNVAAGAIDALSTDAVNGSQLFSVAALANNSVQYDNPGKTSATLAGPTSNDGGVTGGTTVTNLHQGRLTSTSTDAVNGAQLYAVSALANNAVQYDNSGKTSATLAGTASNDGGVTGGTTITNLHQGKLIATSTDAVNGAQVNQVAKSIAINFGGGSIFDPTTGTVTAPIYTVQGNTYSNVGGALNALDGNLTTLNTEINGAGIKYFHAASALPDSLALGADSVAIGPNAVANNASSVAIGNGAQTTVNNSVALGSGSQATRGAQSYVGPYSNAQNNTVGTVSIGASGAERQMTNVADGTQATDAVNLRQLDGAVAEVKQYTNSQIQNVTNNQSKGTAGMFQVSADSTAAPAATGSKSAAGGSGAVASAANSIALGNNANAIADDSVALGNGSVADRTNTVSVGAVGAERQIANVAAGTANTDAVNVKQLNTATMGNVKYDTNPDGSVNSSSLTLNAGGSAAAIHNVANGVASGDAVNYGQLQGAISQSNSYTDNQIAGVKSDINKMEKNANSGISSAIAVASLTQSIYAGQGMASVAVGTYQGQSSFALGISKVSDNGHWVVKGALTTNTQGQFGAGAGAGFHF